MLSRGILSFLPWGVMLLSVCAPSALAQPVDIKINCGGLGFTDTEGRIWQADDYFSSDSIGFATPDDILPAEDYDMKLYQTERYSPAYTTELEYMIPVPTGEYTIRLHFAEIFLASDEVGVRTFNIALEDEVVETNFDILSEVGHDEAIIKNYGAIVTDGYLNIKLSHVNENPKINAIEVTLYTPFPAPSASPSASLAPTLSPSSFKPIYINAGYSGTYTDTEGREWVGDVSLGEIGSYTLSMVHTEDVDIITIEDYDELIYKYERYDPFEEPELSYNIGTDLPVGEYLVRLHFAEIYFGSPNERIFDVYVEGEKVAEDLDLVQTAGQYGAYIIDWNGPVEDGVVTIGLNGEIENPKISAIEIHQTAGSPTTPTTAAPSMIQLPSAMPSVAPSTSPSDSSVTSSPTSPTTTSSPTSPLPARSVSPSASLAPTLSPSSFKPIYINAGYSGTYTDTEGREWVGDVSLGEIGSYTLSMVHTEDVDIITIEDYDELIYKYERYDPFEEPELSYNIGTDLPVGEYLVRLHFAEIYFGSPNERIFDVYVEGEKVAEDLDLVQTAGQYGAYIIDWNGPVEDGVVTIGLNGEIENPKISAIEIHQTAGSPTTPTTAAPSMIQLPSAMPSVAPSTSPSDSSATSSPTSSPTAAPSLSPTNPVNVGPYVKSFKLVEAQDPYGDITTLSNNEVIGLTTNGIPINIIAETSGTIGSVSFKIDGEDYSTENVPPYAIGGDGGGAYNVWDGPLGIHTIDAIIYSGTSGSGSVVNSKTITLDIQEELQMDYASSAAPSSAPTSVDKPSTTPSLRPSADPSETPSQRPTNTPGTPAPSVSPSQAPSTLDPPAPSSSPSQAPSTLSTLGPPAPSSSPSQAPSTLSTLGPPAPSSSPSQAPSGVDSAAPSAKPSPESSAAPSTSTPSGPSVTGFSLVQAESPYGDIMTVSDGDTIILSNYGDINLKADTFGTTAGQESVKFLINGAPANTESVAPFAIAGDMNGQFYIWDPPIGQNIDIEAILYSEPSGSGSILNSKTVTVNIELDYTGPAPSAAPSSSMKPSVSFQPSPAPSIYVAFTPIYINAGGNAFVDSTGKQWKSDEDVVIGGTKEVATSALIDGVPQQDYELYQTGRWGAEMVYSFDGIPDADYIVTLHFADTWAGTTEPGSRVFNVSIEGIVALANFDIIKSAGGGNTAWNSTDTLSAKVEDGELNITFTADIQNPKISGIEVTLVGHRAHAVTGGPYYVVDGDDDGFAVVDVDAALSHTHTPYAELVSFKWKWVSEPGAPTIGDQLVTSFNLPVGEHVVQLEVIDNEGYYAAETTTIVVADSTFPFITSMVPNSANIVGSDEVMIFGTGFVPGQTTVYFGEDALPSVDVKIVNATTIQILNTPSKVMPEEVNVKVQTSIAYSNIVKFRYFNFPIDWTVSELLASIVGPTCVAFGPDGRLYVGTTEGLVYKVTLNEQYQVLSTVVSDAANVANPDYPSEFMPLKARAILGITVDPLDTSPDPKVYIAHSWIFHLQFDGFFGKISTLSGTDLLTYEDLITGLPVSDHDHAVNGIEFGDYGELYIQVGGNTNAGVPGGLSTADHLQPEEVFSAATIVAYNITQPDFDGILTYDNITRDQVTGFDVQVFASGQRNPFDIVLHSNGKLYGTDNGPNYSFGDRSVDCNIDGPEPSHGDKLNLIVEDGYYGHANRKRGEIDPRQCIWRDRSEPSDDDYTTRLADLPPSSNGIIEFQSDHFGGDLRGRLLIGQWGGAINAVTLSEDGTSASQPTNLGLEEKGGLNLAQGPDGTIVITQHWAEKVIAYIPYEDPHTALIVKSVFPRRGNELGGTTLTVYGDNFNTYGTPDVTVGGQPCPITGAVTAHTLTCTVPAGTGTVDVMVSVTTEDATEADVMVGAYRYILDRPVR